jgi:hypothetical protein
MRFSFALLTLAAASASAQSTYTTTNDGTLNLVAGLTTITEYSAANSNATAYDLSLLTDSSWSSTGIFNIGVGFVQELRTGTLAGNFGGGTYLDADYSIILIGNQAVNTSTNHPYWGEWDVQLLLSNGTYSNAIHFTSFNTVENTLSPMALTYEYYNAVNDSRMTNTLPFNNPTSYLKLNISDFDVTNIGVTGIKISGFNDTGVGPDLTYIGVVSGGAPVPEPSTYGLALGGLALAVVAMRRRASKSSK